MPLSDEHREAQRERNADYGRLTARLLAKRLVEEAVVEPPLLKYLRETMGPPPPIPWRERVKRRLEAYRERVVTAWRVLRGEDIHEDCY